MASACPSLARASMWACRGTGHPPISDPRLRCSLISTQRGCVRFHHLRWRHTEAAVRVVGLSRAEARGRPAVAPWMACPLERPAVTIYRSSPSGRCSPGCCHARKDGSGTGNHPSADRLTRLLCGLAVSQDWFSVAQVVSTSPSVEEVGRHPVNMIGL